VPVIWLAARKRAAAGTQPPEKAAEAQVPIVSGTAQFPSGSHDTSWSRRQQVVIDEQPDSGMCVASGTGAPAVIFIGVHFASRRPRRTGGIDGR